MPCQLHLSSPHAQAPPDQHPEEMTSAGRGSWSRSLLPVTCLQRKCLVSPGVLEGAGFHPGDETHPWRSLYLYSCDDKTSPWRLEEARRRVTGGRPTSVTPGPTTHCVADFSPSLKWGLALTATTELCPHTIPELRPSAPLTPVLSGPQKWLWADGGPLRAPGVP